ncbi:MAG: hypothetical protein MK319_06675 [Pseudomonadales bacterium]|nr:hypothetical protein [Pseudomonadales bacterium]
MQKPRVLHSIQRFITEGKRLPIYLGIFVTVFVLWLQIGGPRWWMISSPGWNT